MKQKDFLKLLFSVAISVCSFSTTYGQGQYTWTGATNNDWDTNTNWDNNVVPPNSTDVIIPSGLTNYPTKSSGFIFLNSLIFESGSSILLEGGNIFSDITYKRNLTSNWHLIASPIEDHTFEALIADNDFAAGTGTNIGIGLHDNSLATPWQYKSETATGAIDNKLGMAVKLKPGSSSIVFKGKAFNNIAVTKPVDGITDFTLIGNPYLAYLDSNLFFSNMDNSFLLKEKTIWLWNGTEYITKNLAEPIKVAPTQGFFVRAIGSINVYPAMLSHQTTDVFLRQAPTPSFELSVANNKAKKSTKVFFIDNKTTGFDNGYDSSIFSGVKNKFAVFTQLVSDSKGEKLAIQTLPNANYQNTVIPVGLIAKAKEEITFAVNSKNLPTDVTIYLEDRKNKTFINLSKNEHTISLDEKSNGIGQFYIHTQAKKLNTDTILNDLNNISIYNSDDKEISISGLQGKAVVKVYNTLGKELVQTQINSNGINQVLLPHLSAGIYIVKLNTDLGSITKKIVLK
ncbi:T9SS type A sorting domain-containing protein [Tenacibaculum finnmarkense]|uniref:T9SS type A sorting domain-containing protein n=1 Tax=Tenacibaculum finnmarkense TaxID=2781243 RepID=UPI001E51CD07|nr:T9SS type A sorting domain-containing protein [Tenacibaculum finnmarkense]MCD8411293.1 T9SS type A sorting domain-containing protein [Tenacibaculum finnmarkense genomovar ulcerans]